MSSTLKRTWSTTDWNSSCRFSEGPTLRDLLCDPLRFNLLSGRRCVSLRGQPLTWRLRRRPAGVACRCTEADATGRYDCGFRPQSAPPRIGHVERRRGRDRCAVLVANSSGAKDVQLGSTLQVLNIKSAMHCAVDAGILPCTIPDANDI